MDASSPMQFVMFVATIAAHEAVLQALPPKLQAPSLSPDCCCFKRKLPKKCPKPNPHSVLIVDTLWLQSVNWRFFFSCLQVCLSRFPQAFMGGAPQQFMMSWDVVIWWRWTRTQPSQPWHAPLWKSKTWVSWDSIWALPGNQGLREWFYHRSLRSCSVTGSDKLKCIALLQNDITLVAIHFIIFNHYWYPLFLNLLRYGKFSMAVDPDVGWIWTHAIHCSITEVSAKVWNRFTCALQSCGITC